ncbi:MAG: hypothetical protein K6E34_12130 [Lachnospiraceae bacterium]|nr:hypothetical protein [Lachnospiraceae bacterium]
MIGKENKLSDDQLDEIAGGKITVNNTLFRKDEDTGIKTAVKTDDMDGKVRLVNGMTKSTSEKDSAGIIFKQNKTDFA